MIVKVWLSVLTFRRKIEFKKIKCTFKIKKKFKNAITPVI